MCSSPLAIVIFEQVARWGQMPKTHFYYSTSTNLIHCNPVQGQNRARTGFSLCTNYHRENYRDPVFITGISLWELVHREMGLQCSSGKILIRERFSSWDKYFVVLIIFCPFQISSKCALIRAFLISRALVLSLIHLQTYCLFINLLHIKLHSRLISNQTKTFICLSIASYDGF